MTSCR